MSDELQNLTPQEQQALLDYAAGYGATAPEGKHNAHSFLFNVATSDDTTKTGYLKDEEVGNPRHDVRTYHDIALFADKVMDNPELKDYFAAKAENVTKTSLSRHGFLTSLAVVNRKEIADVTKPKAENKGWFRRKDKSQENQLG